MIIVPKITESEAEILAKNARNSISSYCYSECKSMCCRKGYLILSEKEVGLVVGKKKELFIEEKTLTVYNKTQYLLNIGANERPCPMLLEFRCEIHDNIERPMTCKEFPIFIMPDNKVRFSDRCPAMQEGLFYGFLIEFRNLGYDIV